jgi:tetratricopeptide (TPR) repeat protein
VATLLDPDALRAEVEAARAHSEQGRPLVALARYRSLRSRIERSGDARAEVGAQRAKVMLGLAAAQFEVTGRLGHSMSLLFDAERVAQEAGSVALLASIRGQRGLILLRGGRRRDALLAFDTAAQVRDAAEPYDRVSILLNRGVLHLDIGSLDQAAEDFSECLASLGEANDPLLLWKARHNLAFVDFLAGRIPRALAAMETAERELGGDPPSIGLLDRARVLREAGLVSEADPLLTRAAEDFERAKLLQDLAETELVRAECALVEGDLDRARRLARRAERLFARRENVQWQRRAQLLLLRCDRQAVDVRPAPTRRAALRRLATRARLLADDCRAERRGDLARPALLLALECELRAGEAAEDLAAPQMRSVDPLQARLQTREVRALVALHRGDRVRAASEVRHGLGELGSYQGSFGSLDLRTASAVHGLPLARLGLEIAARSGSAADFFAAVERGRAISTRLAPVGPPTDERTAELLTELRRTQEEARGLEGDAHSAERTATLRGRAARLQREIRARAWELEGRSERPVATSARVADVQAATRARGTAFVSYVVHAGRWRAVVASGRRPRMFDLAGEAEIVELVHRVRADLDALAMPMLPAPLADAVRRSLDAGLRRLDDLLLGPLRLDGSPVVVSCSMSLALAPWSMLPSRRGLPVVVTPGASAWLRIGPRGRRPHPRVVAVAGPGLHRAVGEAEQVQASWPGAELLTGHQATTEEVRKALATADVVHVAGHGTHQQESPLFSSLRLVDGPLYAYELDADGGSAPCVVLSACEAGLATVRPGDEGLGLTSVLLHLGSRSVLAAVARVRDDVADRVMAQVHTSMAAGTHSAQALADALAENDGDQVAPFMTFGSTW